MRSARVYRPGPSAAQLTTRRTHNTHTRCFPHLFNIAPSTNSGTHVGHWVGFLQSSKCNSVASGKVSSTLSVRRSYRVRLASAARQRRLLKAAADAADTAPAVNDNFFKRHRRERLLRHKQRPSPQQLKSQQRLRRSSFGVTRGMPVLSQPVPPTTHLPSHDKASFATSIPSEATRPLIPSLKPVNMSPMAASPMVAGPSTAWPSSATQSRFFLVDIDEPPMPSTAALGSPPQSFSRCSVSTFVFHALPTESTSASHTGMPPDFWHTLDRRSHFPCISDADPNRVSHRRTGMVTIAVSGRRATRSRGPRAFRIPTTAMSISSRWVLRPCLSL